MKNYLLLFLLLSSCCAAAQTAAVFSNTNAVYQDNIRSVKCHISEFPLSLPIVEMGKGGSISLHFDDTDAEMKRYLYSLTLCNANWQPSDLADFEYLTGFNENLIRDCQLSVSTLYKYTHYYLSLPNADIKWTKSGNYLLKVYEENNEKTPVLSRRIMVSEPKMQILATMVPPAGSGKTQTHQEIDFKLFHRSMTVSNPKIEISATVLQNHRWDNAITGIRPFFIYQESMDFDYQDLISFPASKEFRVLDMRNFRFKSEFVESILRYRDGYGVKLLPEKKRVNEVNFFYRDANGGFLIENSDDVNRIRDIGYSAKLQNDSWNIRGTGPGKTLYSLNTSNLTPDYAMVSFTYDRPTEFNDADLYVLGEFNDWQPSEANKLTYDAEQRAYKTNILLKQGYYNYTYAVVHKEYPNALDTEETEGNYYETDNEYSILIYYRPFGERYDRLIAVSSFSSTATRGK